jgi:hypothetical protein
MSKKIVAGILYATTTVFLWMFLDGIYGAGPITRHSILVYSAMLGFGFFVIATLLAPFQRRWSIRCAVAGAALSWPEFILAFSTIPWSNLAWFISYRTGTAIALVCLIASSFYSVAQMLLPDRPASHQESLV